MPIPPKNLNEFSSLVQLISDLRGPEGCEWDKNQTHTTLAPYAIEETYEMIEALESGDDTEFCEELGDVLFQVVIHAELARQRNAFNISDVIQSISEKLLRRHPHVFSNVQVNGTEDIIKNWELIKAEEKKNKPLKDQKKKNFFNSPKGLPALQNAAHIGEKTNHYKFDWSNVSPVIAQLKAEIAELEDVLDNNPENKTEVIHEMGDVLFSAAQVARHLDVEPESALRIANQRFSNRFLAMISECGDDLEKFIALSAEDKEALWKKIKTAK